MLLGAFFINPFTISFVLAQENPYENYFKINTNLTELFGEPIYQETDRITSNSIVLDVDKNIKTQDSYIAAGILKDVGNVIDKSTFVTTYRQGSNVTTSTGHGIFSTLDGEIATYIGQDLGMTDKNGVETFRGIQIFQTESNGKLSILDNLIGLYEYKYWPDGKKIGMIWKWN